MAETKYFLNSPLNLGRFYPGQELIFYEMKNNV